MEMENPILRQNGFGKPHEYLDQQETGYILPVDETAKKRFVVRSFTSHLTSFDTYQMIL